VPRARARSAEAVPRDGSRAAKSLPYLDLYYIATSAYGNGIYLLDAYPQNIFITTQKYNPQTDVWTSVKKIPSYRANSANEQAAVAVTVGSRIYVLGGGAPPSAVRARHEVYSPLADSWTTKKELPSASSAAGAGGGSCGSTVVYAGGYPSKNTFALYNTATDLWAAGERPLRCAQPVDMRSPVDVRCQAVARSAGPNVPISVMYVASASKGNYFYLAGGATGSTNLKSVYIYDCNAGTWAAGKRACALGLAGRRRGSAVGSAALAVQV
jgi:hypothetical protein